MFPLGNVVKYTCDQNDERKRSSSHVLGATVRLCTAVVLAGIVITQSLSAFELSGHRGARGEVAENTLASFEHAYATGVDSVELDVGMTADGVLVVTHDRRLSAALTRTSDGRWLATDGPTIFSLTADSLQAYDVGRIDPSSQYSTGLLNQRAVDGARIPRLEQVLSLTQSITNAGIGLIIEVKTSPDEPAESASPEIIGAALVELIRGHGMTDICIVESFDWRVMAHVQKHAPEIKTAYLTAQQPWLDNVRVGEPGSTAWTAGLDVDDFGGSIPDQIAAAGGGIWAPFFREVDVAAVNRAHALGLRVIVWTVNETTDMTALIRLGVDGMVTDYPTRLRTVMQNLGMSLPPSRRQQLL